MCVFMSVEGRQGGAGGRRGERERVVLLTGALSIFAMSSGSGVPQICRILLR